MSPAPARYLLRIDDLCPTVSAGRWFQLQSLIEEFRLQPILAVVPDNQDRGLELSPPDPEFWPKMRALEAAGAAIGLHGYHHVCLSSGRSLLGLHRTSEFAGINSETQHAWIHDGLHILRGHGLNPKIWVAPRHGFDAATLKALFAQNILLLSDGFARSPICRGGITWIPQQLWGPVEKQRGLWTICVHPNTASDADAARLRNFIASHSAQFTSVDQALTGFEPTAARLADRVQAEVALWRFKASRSLRRVRRSALPQTSKLE